MAEIRNSSVEIAKSGPKTLSSQGKNASAGIGGGIALTLYNLRQAMTDRLTSVSFSGHRTYGGAAADILLQTIETLYDRGFRTFLCGMAVGFDLAAGEALVACRERMPGPRLVAVVPFEGQQRYFPAADRARYERVLSAADQTVVLAPAYHRGCYAVRNNYLVDNSSFLVAWYDGSPGGTEYTVRRARRRGLDVLNLAAGDSQPIMGTLF